MYTCIEQRPPIHLHIKPFSFKLKVIPPVQIMGELLIPHNSVQQTCDDKIRACLSKEDGSTS